MGHMCWASKASGTNIVLVASTLCISLLHTPPGYGCLRILAVAFARCCIKATRCLVPGMREYTGREIGDCREYCERFTHDLSKLLRQNAKKHNASKPVFPAALRSFASTPTTTHSIPTILAFAFARCCIMLNNFDRLKDVLTLFLTSACVSCSLRTAEVIVCFLRFTSVDSPL